MIRGLIARESKTRSKSRRRAQAAAAHNHLNRRPPRPTTACRILNVAFKEIKMNVTNTINEYLSNNAEPVNIVF